MSMTEEHTHQSVMNVAMRIGEAVGGDDYATVMNALAYMLAYGLVDSTKPKEEAITILTSQISELYDFISGTRHIQ
jgi:hypothetical protein